MVTCEEQSENTKFESTINIAYENGKQECKFPQCLAEVRIMKWISKHMMNLIKKYSEKGT